MKRYKTGLVLTLVLLMLLPGTAWGWSEGGHHIIALLAFELLTPEQRQSLESLLAQHPRFAQDFVPPEYLTDQQEIHRWRIGRAGYWPDVARSQPDYNRPNWHFQLAATMTVGATDRLNLPVTPGAVPESATLETQELHIAQAVELCRQVLKDRQQSPANRALALSWLAHLVADAHQPCHAGSLYAERVLPDGDRGANLIRVKQGQNIHFLWDALLGNRFDAGDVRRRQREIQTQGELMAQGRAAAAASGGLDPLTWLDESRQIARQAVYGPEILEAVTAASRGLTDRVAEVNLPPSYLRKAGRIAQQRAALAAHRLAALWQESLPQ